MTDQMIASGGTEPWQDPTRPADERVEALIAEMTLREKLAQLYSVWVGVSPVGGDVAPFQHELTDEIDLDELLTHGLGQLTRPFGSAPVEPAVGALSLARAQRRIMAANRLRIPAIAHEECLAGFTAWGATAYPVPLAWGASFDPELIGEMATRIGLSMRSVGVHQGLAPVLDVARDMRWGRIEETIGEDPYLVGVIGSAYVNGLQSSGIIATLKHFAGYSASRAGRNHAPVSMGPRELNDVILTPFEMVLRDARAGSVMHAYVDVDGVPAAANRELLTGLLRERWNFAGTVVADYFGVTFLMTQHRIAGSPGEAAAAALTAGVDVELPNVSLYGEPLAAEVEAGRVDEELIDGAVRRVLRQKLALGLLDPGWDPLPEGWREADLDDADGVRGRITLDSAPDRALARRVAERSLVLVRNDGILPLAPDTNRRILVVGPTADDSFTLLGCYSFPGHVGSLHPDVPIGIEIPTMLDALRGEFAHATITYMQGVDIDGRDASGIAAAQAAAADHDLVVAMLGDRAGLFGRGTSGEGCDADNLRLPGLQHDLMEALLDSGTPVILGLVEGRPYALGSAPERAAAIIAAFFPGEEGAAAFAGVLSGRVSPSGRLPVSIPARPGGQPAGYLAPPLGQNAGTSNLDPTARYPFGHGLTYTTFVWDDLVGDGARAATGGSLTAGLTVTNVGGRAGVELVQLYLHDPVASVVRPVNRLIGFARVPLDAGESARVSFDVPADVTSFTGRDGRRIVESGALELRFGASSADIRLAARVELTGDTRTVDHTRALHCQVTIERN